MAQHTPGPWAWMGTQHGVYLATTHSGRRYVMGFKRMGMRGAEPTFQIESIMVPASELVRFDVGDGAAKGFAQGKADPSVYRYDVASIDAPDARLIAAAPCLYAALAACADRLEALKEDGITLAEQEALDKARAALAKAQEKNNGRH